MFILVYSKQYECLLLMPNEFGFQRAQLVKLIFKVDAVI